MMWQLWTAFGLMLGYIFSVAFWKIGPSLNWRLMLAAPVGPAISLPQAWVLTRLF